MGTLRTPDIVFSPTQDCERLSKAFQGWVTDKKAIIWVLAHRNASQRRKIRDTYHQLYNESLIDRLEFGLSGPLSGDFKKAVILWTLDPPERDAKLIMEALKRGDNGVNHLQVIIEVACASSPHHLMAVRQVYCSLFDCSIEEDIVRKINPPLRKLLVGLVSSYRYDGEVVDGNLAELEAIKLREAIEKKQLDHDHMVFILGTRNMFQLKATFKFYREKYGNPIEQDIESCGNGHLESILQIVVWCINSPEKHFAEVVRASIVGLGTDEDSLNRAIVSRAEIDMLKIKEEYQNTNNTSLNSAVIGDTSGDYKDFLLALLGE